MCSPLHLRHTCSCPANTIVRRCPCSISTHIIHVSTRPKGRQLPYEGTGNSLWEKLGHREPVSGLSQWPFLTTENRVEWNTELIQRTVSMLRILEGLSWMKHRDYFIQWFSKHSFFGWNHVFKWNFMWSSSDSRVSPTHPYHKETVIQREEVSCTRSHGELWSSLSEMLYQHLCAFSRAI